MNSSVSTGKQPVRPAVFHDTDRFATYSYLTRLLTAEDVVVRWNVYGMSEPASMDMRRRILNVAPIKQDCEHEIPGLIFHEIGHFIWSPQLQESMKDAQEKFQELMRLARNHDVWNVIEDGYIERKVVGRWPGSLKHLKVRYDSMAKHLKTTPSTGSLLLDTLNTLNMNVLGAKWGDKWEYRKEVPKDLLNLLKKAPLITADAWDRAALAGAITEKFELYFLPTKDSIKQLQRDVDQALINPGQSGKGEHSVTMTPEEKDQHHQVQITRGLQPKQPKSQLPPSMQVLDLNSGEKFGELEADEPDNVDFEDTLFVDDDITGHLEEFISNNSALLIGTNSYYMATVVEHGYNGTERVVPNITEIKTASEIQEFISLELAAHLDKMPFSKFQMLMQSKQAGTEAVKLFGHFSKKLETSRGVAQSMYQRFITRANAQAIAATKKKMTGSLDMTRASLYMVYDDVFKRRQMSPNQVNHGYTVMVDWSSSMQESVMELFHRIAELSHFAKLAQIELDVWLYTTNDSLMQPANLAREEVSSNLRDGVLLRGSYFAHILNSKQHNSDQILHRLFALFINAMHLKGHTKSIKNALIESEFLFDSEYTNNVLHRMRGTNIFEALMLACDLSSKMKTDKRAVMLLTDGSDAPNFDTAVVRGEIQRAKELGTGIYTEDVNRFSRVTMGGVDLLNLQAQARKEVGEDGNKYFLDGLSNIRSAASFLAAEDARNRGISVVGVTWGHFTSQDLVAITQGNVIRVDVSTAELKSRNPTVYAKVDNTFITNITQGLLADIHE